MFPKRLPSLCEWQAAERRSASPAAGESATDESVTLVRSAACGTRVLFQMNL